MERKMLAFFGISEYPGENEEVSYGLSADPLPAENPLRGNPP